MGKGDPVYFCRLQLINDQYKQQVHGKNSLKCPSTNVSLIRLMAKLKLTWFQRNSFLLFQATVFKKLSG